MKKILLVAVSLFAVWAVAQERREERHEAPARVVRALAESLLVL